MAGGIIQGIGPDGKTPIPVAVDDAGGIIPGQSLTPTAGVVAPLSEATGRCILNELRQIRVLLALGQGIAVICDPMETEAAGPDLLRT